MIQLYEEWARDVAGLPVVAGRRSARGTLRGAVATYTLEALVGDGRALQVGAAVSCVGAGGWGWSMERAGHNVLEDSL